MDAGANGSSALLHRPWWRSFAAVEEPMASEKKSMRSGGSLEAEVKLLIADVHLRCEGRGKGDRLVKPSILVYTIDVLYTYGIMTS